MRTALKLPDEAPRVLFKLMGIEGVHLSRLDAWLVGNPNNRALRLRVSPRSLLDALWLQLGQKLSDGGVIRQCEQCGGWFEAGPGSGRRSDAKFCSDEHRVIFNSRRRSRSTYVTGPGEGSKK
jgi:hypothetical protein